MSEPSFMKELFHGDIVERLVSPYPEMARDERDNVKAILQSIHTFFAGSVDSASIDEHRAIPDEVLDGLKMLGLFGMTVPTDYGGIGLSMSASCRVIEEVYGLDASLGLTLAAHQGLGFKGIELYGSEEQKRRYLPRLSAGEWVAAFALTEPDAGNDASVVQTHAELQSDGSYVITGGKSWVTNGSRADVFTVFARTSAPRAEGKPKLTAFIVERSDKVKIGAQEMTLGTRGAATTSVTFDSVTVGPEQLLGRPGYGFRVAQEVLNAGRLFLAAGCVGACKRLIRLTTERVRARHAFGRPIADYELIKEKVAWMASETWALESMTYLTTGLVDVRVRDYSLESAMSKIFGSETLWRVANEALRIAGGPGYAATLPYERHLRDSWVNLVFAGTNEILRLFVSLSGIHSEAHASGEIAGAIREPLQGLGLLSDLARRTRSALIREKLAGAHPRLARESAMFESYTSELAKMVTKALRKHGTTIAERELTQKRISDTALDLFALIACISRTSRIIQKRGEEAVAREIMLTQMFAEAAEKRMQAMVQSFDRNLDERKLRIADQTMSDGGYLDDVLKL